MKEATPRSKLSIWLIGLILGPIVLMLWLGRGRLAVIYLVALVVLYCLFFMTIIAGFVAPPAFIDVDLVGNLLGLPLSIVGVIHALKIRETSLRRPWFSRWYAAIPIPFAAFLLAALFIRTFFLQPFNAPSESMIPGLMVGDYFFVSKTAYGYSRHSFNFGPEFSGRIWSAEPKRGDIVVFKLPRDNVTDYVKRLIGLPGDRIQMRDGVLYINGTAVPKRRIADFVNPIGEGSDRPIPQYVETLPNGVTYNVLDMDANGMADNTGEYIVPEGHYFMMGDNRDNTLDNRFAQNAPGGGVGFVPYENLIGPVVLIFWNSYGIRIDNRLRGYPTK